MENDLIDLSKPEPTSGKISLNSGVSLSIKDYSKLKSYLTSRIKYAMNFTNDRYLSMNEIDSQLLGNIILDDKQKKKAKNNRVGYSAKVTDINLPLGQAQIDTAVTALLDMLVPTDKMYEPFGRAEGQSSAEAVTIELNKSADKFNHIVEYHKVISDVLRYNLGGMLVEWSNVIGNQLDNDQYGDAFVNNSTIVFRGNKLTALDMRNSFYDPAVSAEQVSQSGGYAGYSEIKSPYQINELIDQGLIYAGYVEDSYVGTSSLVKFNEKPVLRTPASEKNEAQRSSLDYLFDSTNSPKNYSNLITIYIKLRPNRFGLGDSSFLEVWCFRLLGDRIVYANKLTNAHGRLPIVFATATADSLSTNMIGYSETLIPMQNFASFLINSKQRAYRKQLYGVTFYDKNKVDMRNILTATSDNDFENAYIPVDVSDGQGIGSLVASFNDAPDTTAVMADLSNVKALMQDLLPTDSRQSLANLSRVSQWQAQRTVRETDKRTIKIGRLLNSSLLNPILYMSVYNLLQYTNEVRVQQDDGSYQMVSIAELRDSDLELKITSALRGIDKDLAADRLRDIINSLIQVPNISADINIVKLIRYWSTLMGIDIDLAQFKVDSPFDKLTPEQKQAAYQLLISYSQQVQAQNALPNAAKSLDPNLAADSLE